MGEKPRYVLAATAAAGLCHFCLEVPRYTVLGLDTLHEREVIVRVCRGHLAFLQSSHRAPLQVLAIDGFESAAVDLSRPGDYMPIRHAPAIKSSPLLTPG